MNNVLVETWTPDYLSMFAKFDILPVRGDIISLNGPTLYGEYSVIKRKFTLSPLFADVEYELTVEKVDE